MSACENRFTVWGKIWLKKGLEISSNRLYAPLLLKKNWLKNHAYNIPDFTVILDATQLERISGIVGVFCHLF